MTAVSYLRRSSASQSADTEVSFDAQRTAIDTLAHGRGDSIATEFSDYAKSGGSTNGRHGYHDMVTAIEAGQVTTVYAYSLTRLGRSLLDLAGLKAKCDQRGVVIRTVQDGIDTSTGSGRGYFNILAAVAEMEREWATERTTNAMTRRKARGDAFGHAPLGFKTDRDSNGARVFVPTGEAQVVIDAYKAAGNVEGAARKLTVDGVLTTRERNRVAKAVAKGETYVPTPGVVWRSSVVADILMRNAPELLPDKRASGQRRGGKFLLSQLVMCHCSRFMTPSKGGLDLYCSKGKTAGPAHGQYNLRISKVLPAIKTEAAKYLPAAVKSVVRTSEAQKTALLARRDVIAEVRMAQGISASQFTERLREVDVELERLATSDRAVESLRLLPAGVDFSAPEAEVNEVLRTLWSAVRLNERYEVEGFDWRIEERYYSESARDAHDLAQDAEVEAAMKAGA